MSRKILLKFWFLNQLFLSFWGNPGGLACLSTTQYFIIHRRRIQHYHDDYQHVLRFSIIHPRRTFFTCETKREIKWTTCARVIRCDCERRRRGSDVVGAGGCGLKYDILGQDDSWFLVGVCAALSFFHALCWLVFIFVRVVVRVFAVQLARFALALNAVVVGFLRTDEGPAGVMDNFITEKADYWLITYAYWLLNDAWLLPE